MKFLLLSLFIFLLSHCGKNDYVYWCGDHACVNDKERIEYFKKTMIVEIKDSNKVGKEDSSKIKAIKQKLRSEKKRKSEEEKRLKKQAKIEKKLKIKEIRDNKKRKTTDNSFKKPDQDSEIKSSNEKKVVKKESFSKFDNFNEILDSIKKANKNKSFPDINNFPE